MLESSTSIKQVRVGLSTITSFLAPLYIYDILQHFSYVSLLNVIFQECEAKEKSISSLQETLAAAKQEAKSKADSIESMKEDLVQKDSEIHEHFLKVSSSSASSSLALLSS